MKRLLALLLVLTLLPGITGGAALAANDGRITVSLRIEGFDKCLYYNERCDFIITGGANSVADFLKSMQSVKDFPAVTIETHGNTSDWRLIINGEAPELDGFDAVLKNGDELVIFFCDPDGSGINLPIVDSSRLLSDGILRVTNTEDIPIVGATVEYDKAPMITGENGEIVVPQYNMLAGMHYLQIEKYDEATGAPLVLRYPPDYMMFVPYTDMESGAWYAKAVEYCVIKRLFNGVGDNRFAPNEKMSMIQLIMLLCRIAGEDTTPLPGEPWYSAALTWAENAGILPATRYNLNDSVTREIFIYMFYKTAALDGNTDVSKRAAISAAGDYDEIAAQYVEAIRWAVAAGLIIGVGNRDEGLTIDPKGPVSRAVACQMLMRYYK